MVAHHSTLSRAIARSHQGGADALATAVAQELRCQPRTASAWLWGRESVPRRMAGIVRAAVSGGHLDFLPSLLAPIELAKAGIGPTVLTSNLFAEIQEAVSEQYLRQIAYQRAPSPALAMSLRRATDRAIFAMQQARVALTARHELAS